jgi:hypothetical protein
MFKKIAYTLLIALILIQFFRIDRKNPPVVKAVEFATVNNTPNGVKNILQNSCYDCHSNETKYPWYSNVQPIAWWIKHHINEGRKELNFSEWGNYSNSKKSKKIEECIEMIQKQEMPPAYYTFMHAAAKPDDSRNKLLIYYFNGLQSGARQTNASQGHSR